MEQHDTARETHDDDARAPSCTELLTTKRMTYRYVPAHQGRVQQLTGLIGLSIGPAYVRAVSCWTAFIVIQQNKMAAIAGRRCNTYLTTVSVLPTLYYRSTKIYLYRSEPSTTRYKYLSIHKQLSYNQTTLTVNTMSRDLVRIGIKI